MISTVFINTCRLLLLTILLILSVAAPASAKDPLTIPVEKALSGQPLAKYWRFQLGDDLAWAHPDFDDSGWQTVGLPHIWRANFDEAGNRNEHFGWYRLHVHFDINSVEDRDRLSMLGLYMGQVLSAYELYANGQLISTSGRLPGRGLPVPDYKNQDIVPIPLAAVTAEGELMLALRVWGGTDLIVERWGAGPYRHVPELGNYGQLLKRLIIEQAPAMLLGAICMVFGLYHLYLYYRNRRLNVFLWFGLSALLIGVYSLMLTEWRNYLGLDIESYQKIQFTTLYLIAPLLLQMVWAMMDQVVDRWLRYYQMSFIFIAAVFVIIPGVELRYSLINYWLLWILPSLLLAGTLILKKLHEGRRDARKFAIGGLLFVIACLHDIIVELIVGDMTELLPWGFLALLVAMSISLGDRFAGMVGSLEFEVAERTAALSELNRQLSEIVRVDPLTGVLNRRGFVAEAERELQRMFRTNRTFSIVLADIDHFKSVNDRYGHAAGDHVLKRVSARIREAMRDVDRLARWGGEEFILLLPETDVEGATILAEKLRELISGNVFEFESMRLGVTMTFGVAAIRRGESLESCIARADVALYQGKDQGRNRVMVGSVSGLAVVK